ncbi:relaxin receptor 1-like [Lytechinus pictus]|uniref:relaxin receptor 1-like n=1 Tax=Lytechinus pictus TaxID=7653 RepID=UPI0030B9F563
MMSLVSLSSRRSWIVIIVVIVAVEAEPQPPGYFSNPIVSNDSTVTGQRQRFSCVRSDLTFGIDDVCDGRVSCPYWDDEYICDNNGCSLDEYKCDYGNSFQCVPLTSVCDGFSDCELDIDESLCDPLADCVPSCQCSAYSISCYDNSVLEDRDVWKSARYLNYLGAYTNGTKLPLSMPFEVRGYPLLTQLLIGETGLNEMVRADFENLTELIILDLSYNTISRIEDLTFNSLNKLAKLHLAYNSISSLSNSTFTGLNSLATLDLSHNVIRSLPSGAFAGLTSLEDINLEYNAISRIEAFTFADLNKLTYLDLQNNEIESLSNHSFIGLTSLRNIMLRYNRIAVLPTGVFRDLHSMEDLDLHFTGIEELKPGCFQGMDILKNLKLNENSINSLQSGTFMELGNLANLFLSHNNISDIAIGAFAGLHSLRFLDLEYNNIREARKGIFDDQFNLAWLSFTYNPLEYIEPGTFQNLSRLENLNMVNVQLENLQADTFTGIQSLRGLSTDDYRLCCLFEETDNCSIITTTFLDSCSRLMPNTFLRISLWVIGLGALIGNITALALRCRKDDSPSAKTQGLFITNLAIADFLMGVYMIIISSADAYFGEYFFLVAEQWRGSIACKFAGFIAFLSSETSVFILAIITIDRVLCVVFPFGKIKFRATSARVGVALIWTTSFVVSIVPLILSSYVSGFYGLSDVCMGLPLNVESKASGELMYNTVSRVWEFVATSDTSEGPSWAYSIAIFLGVNFSIFILILISYVVVFVSARRSARSVASKGAASSADRAREVKLAIRMSVIVLTDFFCWMPVIIMGILSQSGAVTLPVSLYAWSVVFILPINASINPYIYTFIALCGGSKKKPTSRSSKSSKSSMKSFWTSSSSWISRWYFSRKSSSSTQSSSSFSLSKSKPSSKTAQSTTANDAPE